MKKVGSNLIVGIAVVFLLFGLERSALVLAATTPSLGLAATYGILASTFTNTAVGKWIFLEKNVILYKNMI
jgi:hypothetical protein